MLCDVLNFLSRSIGTSIINKYHFYRQIKNRLNYGIYSFNEFTKNGGLIEQRDYDGNAWILHAHVIKDSLKYLLDLVRLNPEQRRALFSLISIVLPRMARTR